MTDHSLASNFVENFDRLSMNQLSKSSPSRLPPFQLKRSRSQQAPVPPLATTTHINDSTYNVPATTTSPPLPTSKFSTQANHHNSNNSNKPSNLSHVPCKFFKQGTCTAGANCIFSHNPDPTCESSVCKYFLKGNCKFGSKCALLHTMSPYTTDGRKLLANQHHHHRDRNLGANNSPSTSSMASAMAAAAAAAAITNGNNDGGLALSLGSSSGLQNLRSPPIGSPLDFGPHMYSPARGSFFDQPLSASADARSYSHLTAAIHRQQDSSLHDPRRKLSTTSSNGYDSLSYTNKNTNGSGRAASSPGADLSSSPFGQRSLFLHPNNTPSSAISMPPPSSSLSRHAQALHSIPESSAHFLDVPQHQPNNFGQDYFGDDDHNDLNDAMLPSSLNELLTPNELQLRKAREHQHQQLAMSQRNYPTTTGAGLERSSSESMRYKVSSPLAAKSLDMAYAAAYDPSSWQQVFANSNNKNDDFYDDQLLQQSASVGNTNAINIPGGSKPAKPVLTANLINHNQHQDEYRINKSSDNDLFSPFTEADDEGPFYMEDAGPVVNGGTAGTISGENGRQVNVSTSTTATTDDRHRLLTPFEFPSLKS